MLKIPRHLFVPENLINLAYSDTPLPIGFDQTISQPYTIAFMLENLELKKNDKVLEIGTGSGYSAALINYITKSKVYSIEIVKELAEIAKENLGRGGIKNIYIINNNGNFGLDEYSPYNKILINAACSDFPKKLIKQLKEGGIILAPIGGSFGQEIIKAVKKNNNLIRKSLGNFIFVPLKEEFGGR
jgi:protein-L-isoaspartate(D-aspartate) O-methyltransferase